MNNPDTPPKPKPVQITYAKGLDETPCSPSSIVEFIRRYNRWRRGDESLTMESPKAIGDALDATDGIAERLERQRDIAVAELRRIENTYGHKSAPGCGCDDCHQIRPIEEALRSVASLENTKAQATPTENEYEN